MPTTWIVAADASRARIFEIADPERHLGVVEEFDHPEGRASNREPDSDAQVRAPVQEPFSRTLSRYLDKARTQHRYDKLYLIAPPEFLGLMRESLSKEVRRITAEEVNKDLSWFGTRDMERYVKLLSRPAWARDEKANGGRKARPAGAS